MMSMRVMGVINLERWLKAKHAEFEQAAHHSVILERCIEKNAHDIPQHVVHFQNGGVMRWPYAYEHGVAAWNEASDKVGKHAGAAAK
jgi:hypothetical protein